MSTKPTCLHPTRKAWDCCCTFGPPTCTSCSIRSECTVCGKLLKSPPTPSEAMIRMQRTALTLAGIKACVKSLFANIEDLGETDDAELLKIYNDLRRISGRAVGIDTDAEDARDAKRLGLVP